MWYSALFSELLNTVSLTVQHLIGEIMDEWGGADVFGCFFQPGMRCCYSISLPIWEAVVTYYFSSGKDDGQAEGWDHDARREEDGELFAGIAGRVCVVDHSSRNAVRDGREDVEEEEEQRPVFAAKRAENHKYSYSN